MSEQIDGAVGPIASEVLRRLGQLSTEITEQINQAPEDVYRSLMEFTVRATTLAVAGIAQVEAGLHLLDQAVRDTRD